ncbi:MAG: peptidylprolyl isomerase [Caulobacter sp.]|nr:peptidylprolyl isomerase [Caulobacter sp.]
MGTTNLLSTLKVTGRILATVSVIALATAGMPAASFAQDLPPAEAPVQPDIAEGVAAVVNDDIISSYDLVQRMKMLILTTGFQPTPETLPQLQAEAQRQLIDERLKKQELRRVEKENKTTILATDAEIDEVIAETVQGQYKVTADQFYAQLAAQGIGRDTYREQARVEYSWEGYMRGRYGQRLRIGQDQIKAVQKRLSDAASKPQYQVSEIFIDNARVGGPDVAFNGAQSLIAQLQQGAPFPQVARQFSAAPTAASGGDAGWVSPGEMPPEVDAVMDSVRPGQISPPIPTQDGVYIIWVREKRAGGTTALVTLKQAAVSLDASADQAAVDAASASLEQLRALKPTCADLEAKAGQLTNVVAGDMGEIEISGLTGGFAEAAANTPDNQLSATPIRTDVGVHLVMVCGKRNSGGNLPTPEQIERRLHSQALDLISKRVMRDLKMQATIENR